MASIFIEHDFSKGFKIRTNTGTEAIVADVRNKRAVLSSRREGALKEWR
jgi:hypothetical protein